MTNYGISSWPKVHNDLQREEMISCNWNIQRGWESDARSLLRSPATDICVRSCYIPPISCPPAPSLLSNAKGHHVPRPADAPRDPEDLTQLALSIQRYLGHSLSDSCQKPFHIPLSSHSPPLLRPLDHRRCDLTMCLSLSTHLRPRFKGGNALFFSRSFLYT